MVGESIGESNESGLFWSKGGHGSVYMSIINLCTLRLMEYM